jgi:hypothetical protein
MTKPDANVFDLSLLDHHAVRFQHFHEEKSGRLCLTIASKMKSNSSILFAGAIVSSKDRPNKKIGKQIALSRLLSDRDRAIEMDIEAFRYLVSSRRIIGLFDHPDRYRLRQRRINDILIGR